MYSGGEGCISRPVNSTLAIPAYDIAAGANLPTYIFQERGYYHIIRTNSGGYSLTYLGFCSTQYVHIGGPGEPSSYTTIECVSREQDHIQPDPEIHAESQETDPEVFYNAHQTELYREALERWLGNRIYQIPYSREQNGCSGSVAESRPRWQGGWRLLNLFLPL